MKRKLLSTILLAVLAVVGAKADPAWTPSSVGAGEFMLYNVGSGKWLNGANSWGTRASVCDAGIFFNLTASSDNFILSTASTYGSGKNLNIDDGTPFVDNRISKAWTFTETGTGTKTYTISDGTYYLVWDGTGTSTVSVTTTAPTTSDGYWQLLTKAALVESLSSATVENPLDATFFIGDPDFNRAVSPRPWSVSNMDIRVQNKVSDSADNGWKYTAEGWNKNFYAKQTLTGMPSGKYKLKVSGFYDQEAQHALLYAGDESVKIRYATGGDKPASQSAAAESFAAGNLVNELEFTLAGSSIEIGVKKETTISGDWCVVDMFRLQYLGPVTVEYVSTPSASITAANGNDRTITIVPGESAMGKIVTTYYTTDGSTPTSSSTAYSAPFTISANTTLKVVSISSQDDTASEIFETNYEAGTTIQLNTPTTTPAQVEGGTQHTLAIDLGNTFGSPTVTYYVNGEAIVGNTYTVTGTSATVVAKATGYADSETLTIYKYVKTTDLDLTGSGFDRSAWTEDPENAGKYYTSASGANAIDGLTLGSATYVLKSTGLGQTTASSANIGITNVLTGQMAQFSWNDNSTSTEYENNGALVALQYRDRNNNGENNVNRIVVYTPIALVATAADVISTEGVVDLSDKVIYSGNIDAITAAITSTEGITTVKIAQLGSGVDITTFIAESKRNNIFIQLPATSFYTDKQTANFKSSTGAVLNYILTDKQPFAHTADFTAAHCSYSRTMTANVWNTLVVPFDMDKPEGWTVKEPTAFDGSTITFSDASSIVAGKPYIVKPTETVSNISATDVTLKKDLNPTTVGTLTMTGTYTEGTVPTGDYIIGIKDGASALYLVDSSVSIKPFRAYFSVTNGARSMINMAFDDETTSVKSLTPSPSPKDEGSVYTLSGLRIDNPKTGLYISNGKKIIVR